jgi:sugar lactone lactonase YvrE
MLKRQIEISGMQLWISRRCARRAILLAVLAASAYVNWLTNARADEVLIADRLSDSVYRYSESGQLLGTLIDGTTDTFLNQPIGLAISHDRTKLFVSSFGGGVTRYDYSYATHTATNPFALPTTNLAVPNAMLFSPDGNTLYVSNLGATGVARFHVDGSGAGPPLTRTDGSQTAFTGLAFNPEGKLLVGVFNDNSGNGAVDVANLATGELSDFVSGSPSLTGGSGVIVHRNQLYVTGMFASTIRRFDATTGAPDPTFAVNGLGFPQQLMPAPDLNGFFVGVLGVANGAGNVPRYDYDGNLLGTFASPGGGGFTEGTAFVTSVPEPTRGDFNLDGHFTSADLPMMLKALTDLDSYKAAKNITQADLLVIGDYDNSNSITNSDIQGLLGALAAAGGGSIAAVPEPNAAILAGMAFFATAAVVRRRSRRFESRSK